MSGLQELLLSFALHRDMVAPPCVFELPSSNDPCWPKVCEFAKSYLGWTSGPAIGFLHFSDIVIAALQQLIGDLHCERGDFETDVLVTLHDLNAWLRDDMEAFPEDLQDEEEQCLLGSFLWVMRKLIATHNFTVVSVLRIKCILWEPKVGAA